MTPIAIVGMACLYPGARDLASYWRNIVAGVDAISDVPPGRWEPEFYDAQATTVDRFYCRRGGFVDADAEFDPLAYGIMPRAAAAGEPEQWLALQQAYAAMQDAGYHERAFQRDKAGVILGRGNYVSAGVLRLEQHVRLVPQFMHLLQDLFPDLPQSSLELARARLQAQLPTYGADVAAGMIPNLLASRIAHRLDLQGPAYTVDAACASSLIALEQACQRLHSGEADLMLAGGVHLSHDLTFWATFCQLGALSRQGVARPLAADADGILAGEGIGMVVLRRLADAEAAGDRIYAVIAGVGSASDGRQGSLVAPSVEGQLLALARAWSGSGLAPEHIGLLEAHGTGTPAGDAAEIETLRRHFGSAGAASAVIGSVKSMIGHTMPAAGMAGLIKAAMAVYHGVLPPTLHCERPHAQLATTRFRPLAAAQAWTQTVDARIAAVNAFGFGGINAHVVLRGHQAAAPLPAAEPVAPPEVWLLSADDLATLRARFERGERDATPGQGRHRLAIVEPTAARLAQARKVLASGKTWPGRQQIYYSGAGLISAGGQVTLLFPGVDSRFEPQVEDLARYFGRPLPAHCRALDPAQSLVEVVIGLLGCNRLLFDILMQLRLPYAALAGHSVGEWSAMLAGGMMSQELSDRTNAGLDVASVRFPDVFFLAASCDHACLEESLAGLPDIALSHDNCPHQVIACGRRSSIESAQARLQERGVLAQVLPFVSGFHSPLFAAHMDWYRDFFAQAELRTPHHPVWSATLAAEFPDDAAERRRVALAHLLQPVRFRETIEALYAQGQRVFIQVGTGSLPGFVADTLAERPHRVFSMQQEGRSGLLQLTCLSAALWVEGAQFDTRLLARPAASHAPTQRQRLALGVPLLRIPEPLPWPGAALLPMAVSADPVERCLQETLAEIEQAGQEVRALWQQRQRPAPPLVAVHERLRLDVSDNIGAVADHALYPQRPGWPVLADTHPVVPLTMELTLLRQVAERAYRGLKVIEVSSIEAYNWLLVSSAQEVDIVLQPAPAGYVDAEIRGYCRARLHLASDYPAAPAAPFAPLTAARQPRVDAQELYAGQWMFHGPAYQGVQRLGAISDEGIEGDLVVRAGPGALLDAMGQLAGYWVMEQPDNCLAMPIGVASVRFYDTEPGLGEVLQASVRIRHLDALNAHSDHQLHDAQGRLRISIGGWHTRRYQMDKALWEASRQLQYAGVSRRLPAGVFLFVDRYDTAILRDYLARRYLNQAEMRVYEGLSPRRRRSWLNGRIAAKDAIAAHLRARGHACVYPKEIHLDNDASGAPQVRAYHSDLPLAEVRVSIAHKPGYAVAMAAERAVGVDIETIGERDAAFIDLALSAEEVQITGTTALAVTRAWAAKEAVAKWQGSGLQGDPRRFRIEAGAGDQLHILGLTVRSLVEQGQVIAWVEDAAAAVQQSGTAEHAAHV